MRNTWRQPCTTPEDVFFALAVQPHNLCSDAILPLVHRSYSVNSETIAAYLSNMPRPLYITKSPKQNDRTKKKILELKARIKIRVYEQNLKADADAVKSMQQKEQMALDSLQSSMNVTDSVTLLTLGSMALDMNDLLAELK
jgi:hypothetical protein